MASLQPTRCLRLLFRRSYPTNTFARTYSSSHYNENQSSASIPPTSPFAPRHFMSIADLSPRELTQLVRSAFTHKASTKSGFPNKDASSTLINKTIALLFSKLSTRTRVSTESAVVALGGHPMFLGAKDIQLGVNETLRDSSIIISSMTAGIVARVDAHSTIADLAKHSSVPVINALSDDFHPMQTIADVLTISEAFPSSTPAGQSKDASLGLEGLKLAWVGDSNNVLYDLAIAAMKLGVEVTVATPKGYEIPQRMREIIMQAGADAGTKGLLSETNIPEEAVKNADVIVTDTWISMGWESEKEKRLKDFEGFQVTAELARRGGAKDAWRFMHCLPRKPEEVDDDVFYGPKSLVFQEGENRLWAAIAVLEAFVVNKGKIV